jgi:hypothetical protein
MNYLQVVVQRRLSAGWPEEVKLKSIHYLVGELGSNYEQLHDVNENELYYNPNLKVP